MHHEKGEKELNGNQLYSRSGCYGNDHRNQIRCNYSADGGVDVKRPYYYVLTNATSYKSDGIGGGIMLFYRGWIIVCNTTLPSATRQFPSAAIFLRQCHRMTSRIKDKQNEEISPEGHEKGASAVQSRVKMLDRNLGSNPHSALKISGWPRDKMLEDMV